MKRLTEANYFYHFDFQSKKKNYKEETQSITKYIAKYIINHFSYQSQVKNEISKKRRTEAVLSIIVAIKVW